MMKIVREVKQVISDVKVAFRQQVFEIEYEIFPLRAIYYLNVEAKTEQEALQKFWDTKPRAIVRSVNDIQKSPFMHNPNVQYYLQKKNGQEEK